MTIALHDSRAPMLPPTPRTDQRPAGYFRTAVSWLIALVTFAYMLPWAIAVTRGRANRGTIGAVNLFFGWTVIGWIVAMLLATSPHKITYQPYAVNLVITQNCGHSGH